jgi:hypothetical protein
MKLSKVLVIYFLLPALVISFSCSKSSDANASANAGGSGAGGSLARFAISGNYLYLVSTYTLTVFDITDPTKPVKKAELNPAFDIETIFPYKDKLFLGAQTGMYVYSIANPANPVKQGSITHFRSCDPVVSNDSLAYVTLRSFGTGCGSVRNVLNVYNIKNITAPSLTGTVDMKSPYGLGIKDRALYVCEGENGMVLFDLANPYTPKKKREFTDQAYFDVIPFGDVLIAYIEKGVCFYDISNPLFPVLLSTVKG